MTLRHLQIFRAVCDCGSITAAADRLNVTQPSVSMAIRELEAFYQTRLFDRINRKIYLTEAGTMLRQYTDTMLDQYDDMTILLREGKVFTKCRIGVNISVAETLLPDVIRKARARIPDINLNVLVHNTETIEQKLADNQIDFAILDNVKDSASRNSRIFDMDDMVIVCSPYVYYKDSMTIGELAEKPLLLREEGSGLRSCVEGVFARHGYGMNIIMESTSTLALAELADGGLGFTVLPLSIVKKLEKTLCLKTVKLEDDIFRRNYYLVYNKKKHLTYTMTEFLKAMERADE